MNQDPNDTLRMCIVFPAAVVTFIVLGFILVYPEKRTEYFPMLREYQVRIDFNELARIREIATRNWLAAHGQPVAQTETVALNPDSNAPVENTTATETTTVTTQNPESEPTPEPEPEQTANLPNKAPDLTDTSPRSTLLISALPPTLPALTPPVFVPPELPPKKGKPLKFVKATLKGIPFYQATVDLKDPEMFLSIEVANNAAEANSATVTHGDESFESFVKRSRGAVVQNGTFFSKDNQKRVMGNMVSSGRYLKYSQWENYGTTLGIRSNNEPEMVTARTDGQQPDWSQHWFSLTSGPRLLRAGEVDVEATAEGFADPHVLGVGPRCAIGFNAAKDKIFIVTFLKGLSLPKEAEVMKAMGCFEAMNIDGGASRAVAHNGEVIVPASRALTNVIVVYDTKFKAPKTLISSWKEFQRRPDQLVSLNR
jgi:hypothetical protein